MALNRKQTIKRVIFVVIITHIGLGLWFVERGLLNADEGWYLYAARQMAQYTCQMLPAVDEVCGLPARLPSPPGLRCLSCCLSFLKST